MDVLLWAGSTTTIVRFARTSKAARTLVRTKLKLTRLYSTPATQDTAAEPAGNLCLFPGEGGRFSYAGLLLLLEALPTLSSVSVLHLNGNVANLEQILYACGGNLTTLIYYQHAFSKEAFLALKYAPKLRKLKACFTARISSEVGQFSALAPRLQYLVVYCTKSSRGLGGRFFAQVVKLRHLKTFGCELSFEFEWIKIFAACVFGTHPLTCMASEIKSPAELQLLAAKCPMLRFVKLHSRFFKDLGQAQQSLTRLASRTNKMCYVQLVPHTKQVSMLQGLPGNIKLCLPVMDTLLVKNSILTALQSRIYVMSDKYANREGRQSKQVLRYALCVYLLDFFKSKLAKHTFHYKLENTSSDQVYTGYTVADCLLFTQNFGAWIVAVELEYGLSKGDTPQDQQDALQLVRKCKNVKHVTFRDYPYAWMGGMWQAVIESGSPRVASITFSKHGQDTCTSEATKKILSALKSLQGKSCRKTLRTLDFCLYGCEDMALAYLAFLPKLRSLCVNAQNHPSLFATKVFVEQSKYLTSFSVSSTSSEQVQREWRAYANGLLAQRREPQQAE